MSVVLDDVSHDLTTADLLRLILKEHYKSRVSSIYILYRISIHMDSTYIQYRVKGKRIDIRYHMSIGYVIFT